MANKPTLGRLFQNVHRALVTQLEVAKDTLDHPTAKGTKTEDYWIEMFRSYLPRRYDIHRAFVIDSNDSRSQQIDIVVHDRQYSPFVLNLNGEFFVPAESVYAVLEVRQTMNAENVRYAGKKIASVRRLHRTSMPVPTIDGVRPPKGLHPIIGGLLTFESKWNPPFGRPFRNVIGALSMNQSLDIGCAAQHGVFDIKYAPGRRAAIATQLSRSSLAVFLLRFIARLQSIATVPCIDVLAYADNIGTQKAK